MGGEERIWRHLAHYQLISQQGPHFSPHSKAKEAQISGKLVTSGISAVAIALVHSDWRAPEIDFRYETEARKVMVDFKFDALYR